MSDEDVPDPEVPGLIIPNKPSDETRSKGDIGDEDEDESLFERLYGLMEMFPEPLRNGFSKTSSGLISVTKSTYATGRFVAWVCGTTAIMCFLPLAFELERVQWQDQEAAQHRQMLLGPQASGAGNAGIPAGFSSIPPIK